MTEATPTPRQYERFESFAEYEDRLDALIPAALATINVFQDRLTPRYNATLRIDLLRAFLRGDSTRRVRIVVHDAAALVRDFPRLLALARDLHPRLEIRQTLRTVRHIADPCVVIDGRHYLHRFHYSGMRAAAGRDDMAGAQELTDRYEALWEASSPVGHSAPAGL